VLYPSDKLRQQALSTVAIENPRGWRIAKEKASKKIDAIVALAMACCAAMVHRGRRPRFDRERLRSMLQAAYDPPFRGYLIASDQNILGVKPEADPKGPIRMHEQPKLGHRYVIGAHEGEGGEKSAYVIDRRDLSLCVEFHGRGDADLFAAEVIKLGKIHNDALIGCIDDDCTVYQILRRRGYSRLYRHDNSIPKVNWIAGAIDGVDTLIREGCNWPSKGLVEELISVVVKEDGKVELRGKSRVTAIAIAIKVAHDSSLASIYPSLKGRGALNEKENTRDSLNRKTVAP
jgi:hypothetical protein